MTVAQVAHDMREYIEEHGWVQDQEEDPETGRCAWSVPCVMSEMGTPYSMAL